jgi:hypothetical protein
MTIRRIIAPVQLRDLAVELGVRPDWHEPDEQEVGAEVYGESFDNAGFWGAERLVSGPGMEMWVRLYKDGQPVADVNLATLFAWAARDGHGGDSL